MTNSADLHRAVQTTLATRQLGTPVFVRYLYHHQGSADAVLARLTHTVGVVRDWLGQTLQRVYAMGGVKERHITLTLECQTGATALISWIGTPGGIDLTVVGNHGAIYHDLGSANAWVESQPAPDPAPDKDLQALIERALASGRPEAGGSPP